jgi:hypothetical protein
MANRKIPKFSSIKEEAKFWDTHDVTDYLGDLKEERVAFVKEGKEENISLRVQAAFKKRLEKIAQNYGLDLSSLIRLWVIDNLKRFEKTKSLTR